MLALNWRLLGIVLAGLLFISGCNDQSIMDGSHSLSKADKKKEEIIVWHTYSEEETKVFENKVIPLFEKQHPDIDVKPVRQPYGEQLKWTLLARASAKRPPDIVRMDISWVPFFAKMGQIYSISDFNDFNQVKEGLLEAPLKSNLLNEKYYGLPLNTNTKVAIFNRQLLKNAGYTSPPGNMDELLGLILKNNYHIGLTGYTAWDSLPYFYGFGGTLLSPDLKKAEGYINSPKSIQAAEKLRVLFNASGNSDTWEGVIDGEYLMIDEGPWFYSIQSPQKLEEIMKNTISVPFPITNGKGSILGGENLVIMKGATNPQASWTFVKWMATSEPQKLLMKTGLMPTAKGLNIKESIKESGYIDSYITGLENSFSLPPLANWGEIEEIYIKYIRMIILDQIGAKEGLSLAAKEMDNQLLKEKGR